MKLVEILARDLKEWPEFGTRFGQLSNGWLIADGISYTLRATLAEDWEIACVTRPQWQAERDRMKTMEKEITTATEKDIEFIKSPFYQEIVLNHKLMQERRKDEDQYVEGVKRIQDGAFDAALKELEQKILALPDQPTYEQQLWDRVASNAIGGIVASDAFHNYRNFQGQPDSAAFFGAAVADTFMAERAKRVGK